MSTVISKLYNANIYLNGDSYAGQGEEVTLPEVKAVEADHKALSNFGKFKLPTGLDEMSLKIKWNTVSSDILKNSADMFTATDIMVRSNMDNWEGSTKTGSVPVVAIMRGLSRKVPGLGIKQQDNVESETEYNVTAYKLEIDGQVIFDIDFFANVYIVDGVDKLADYRANLGL